jgi:excisionase family DNA binding protein
MATVDLPTLARTIADHVAEMLRENAPSVGHGVEHLLLTPKQVGQMAGGVSDWYVMQRIRAGEIKAVRVGKRWKIPVEAGRRFINTRPSALSA